MSRGQVWSSLPPATWRSASRRRTARRVYPRLEIRGYFVRVPVPAARSCPRCVFLSPPRRRSLAPPEACKHRVTCCWSRLLLRSNLFELRGETRSRSAERTRAPGAFCLKKKKRKKRLRPRGPKTPGANSTRQQTSCPPFQKTNPNLVVNLNKILNLN